MSQHTSTTRILVHRMRLLKTVLLVLLLCPCSAEAYIDPGTGSFMLQMLLAGLFGAAVTVKLFWQRFKAFFVGLRGRRDPDPEDDR